MEMVISLVLCDDWKILIQLKFIWIESAASLEINVILPFWLFRDIKQFPELL